LMRSLLDLPDDIPLWKTMTVRSIPSDPQTADEASKGFLSRFASEFTFIRGNFLILVLSWLVMDFAGEMPGTYYPLYVKALGGSAVTIGLIGSVQMISQALVQFPGGYLADKYGRKWIISTMTFGVALSQILYAFAPTWQFIMLGAVIQSLCMIYRPALSAIIMDSLPAGKRGMGFSIINLITSVSTTPSPLIAGMLYAKLGLVPSMRVGYTVALSAYFGAAVLRLRLKETVDAPRRIDRGELLRSYPRSIVESIRVWRLVPRSALALFISDFIIMFSISLFQPILVIYIVEDLGVSPVSWSLIMTTLFVSMIVLSIPGGKLIDRVGKKTTLLASYILWIIAVPLLIYGDFIRIMLAMPLLGLLQVLVMASSSALFADLVPKEHRGKTSGSRGFFTLIAMSVGQLLSGMIYEGVSHQMPFLLQLVFIFPSFLLVLFFVKEPKNKEE